MRTLTCTLCLAAAVAFAESPQDKLNAFREKTAAERHRLGLDKNDNKLGTPEVSFVGAASDGVNAVLCIGQSLTVKLKGVAPKSLVLPTVDDVQVTKESWSGTEWTGTLTAKKTAAPRTFGLNGVLASTAQTFVTGPYLLGCSVSLTFEVEGASYTTKVDLKKREQEVTGEWKKSGKSIGQRKYQLRVSDEGLTLNAVQDPAEQMRAMSAMGNVMESPKWKELDKRQEVAMQKMEACTKLPIAQMQGCMKPVEAEMKKLAADRDAVMADAEKGGSPAAGCIELRANFEPEPSTGRQCAGHRTSDEVPLKWSWTSP